LLRTKLPAALARERAPSQAARAAEHGPSISGIYYEMGNSYGKLKMYDDAIASYLKEKEKSGDDPDVELALANAYQAKGMTQQAQEAKGRAEQLKGGHQDQ